MSAPLKAKFDLVYRTKLRCIAFFDNRFVHALDSVSQKNNRPIRWRMVAQKVGISPGYMSKILTGNKNLELSLALKIAWALETCQTDLDNVPNQALLNELASRRLMFERE